VIEVESNPSFSQRQRLQRFLFELAQLSRRYQLRLDTLDHEVQFIDITSETVVGLDLHADTEESGVLKGYNIGDSILDGVWLVDTPNGPVEQRELWKKA
jgi:hypothetical protein